MTGRDERFSKVYFRLVDEFPAVYYEDRLVAAWLRLLVAADRQYPDHPEIPRHVDDETLGALVTYGLVILMDDGQHYRMRGQDAERERRRERARAAGLASGKARRRAKRERNTNASSTPVQPEFNSSGTRRSLNLENRVESKSSTTATDVLLDGISTSAGAPRARRTTNGAASSTNVDAPAPDDERTDRDSLQLQKLAESLTGVPYVLPNVYTGLGGKAVTEQLRPHGYAAVENAWTTIAEKVRARSGKMPTIRQLVLGADDLLNPVPGVRPDAKEQQEQERRSYDRRVERTRREIARMKGESA